MNNIVLIPKNNEVIVKRSEWLRGDPHDSSLFSSHHEQRCCLGFWCNACGIKDEKIKDIPDPAKAGNGVFDIGGLTKYGSNTPVCEAMMMINDNSEINDTDRERILTTLAQSLDVTMTFID